MYLAKEQVGKGGITESYNLEWILEKSKII